MAQEYVFLILLFHSNILKKSYIWQPVSEGGWLEVWMCCNQHFSFFIVIDKRK